MSFTESCNNTENSTEIGGTTAVGSYVMSLLQSELDFITAGTVIFETYRTIKIFDSSLIFPELMISAGTILVSNAITTTGGQLSLVATTMIPSGDVTLTSDTSILFDAMVESSNNHGMTLSARENVNIESSISL